MMKMKMLSVLGAVLLCLGSAAAADAPLYIRAENDLNVTAVREAAAGKASDQIQPVAPAEGAIVPLLSEGQKAYVNMPRAERIAYFANQKKRLEMKALGYYPLSVSLECKCAGGAPHKHTFTISEKQDFSPAVTVTSEDCKVGIFNLKIAQKYYWNVKCDLPGTDQPVSKTASFTTEDKAPRLLKIDGVPNVRDLGGRKGLGGKRVKQGLIYRTAGLNDNATQRYKTLKEVLKDPALRAEYEERVAIINACKAELKEKKTVRFVPFSISKEWTVFRPKKDAVTPANYEEFAKLTAIPDEYCGAKAEKVTANDKWCIVFPGKTPYLPTFFIQEFEAAEDGIMQVGCGGDWFWQVYINGKKAADLMRRGNFGFPIAVTNYALELPVKKGKNILTVSLLSGAVSWTWCLGKPEKERTHERMLEKRIAVEQKVIDGLKSIPAGPTPGRNRLNPAMKKYIVENLGWKSDIDLRSDHECFGMTGSPVGKEVTWFHYSSRAYGAMQNKEGKEAFSKVFKVFLDDKNYPIDFHCIAGQDRTGAVAFILNGLLGVSEEDLYLDWEVTGFWNPSLRFVHKSLFNYLIGGFEKEVQGDTIQQKIENYVLSLGFTKQDIEFFRAKMLE